MLSWEGYFLKKLDNLNMEQKTPDNKINQPAIESCDINGDSRDLSSNNTVKEKAAALQKLYQSRKAPPLFKNSKSNLYGSMELSQTPNLNETNRAELVEFPEEFSKLIFHHSLIQFLQIMSTKQG